MGILLAVVCINPVRSKNRTQSLAADEKCECQYDKIWGDKERPKQLMATFWSRSFEARNVK